MTRMQQRKVITRGARSTTKVKDGRAKVYDCEVNVGAREGGRTMVEIKVSKHGGSMS